MDFRYWTLLQPFGPACDGVAPHSLASRIVSWQHPVSTLFSKLLACATFLNQFWRRVRARQWANSLRVATAAAGKWSHSVFIALDWKHAVVKLRASARAMANKWLCGGMALHHSLIIHQTLRAMHFYYFTHAVGLFYCTHTHTTQTKQAGGCTFLFKSAPANRRILCRSAVCSGERLATYATARRSCTRVETVAYAQGVKGISKESAWLSAVLLSPSKRCI
jgi:hypothetical protein